VIRRIGQLVARAFRHSCEGTTVIGWCYLTSGGQRGTVSACWRSGLWWRSESRRAARGARRGGGRHQCGCNKRVRRARACWE